MRGFSKFEKQVMTYMLHRNEPMQHLTAHLIYHFCGAIMLCWETGEGIIEITIEDGQPHTNVKSKEHKQGLETRVMAKDCNEVVDKLFDIIALLRYLEQYNYLLITFAPLVEDGVLTDRDKYSNKDDFLGIDGLWIKSEDGKVLYYVNSKHHRMKCGIVEHLDHYVNSTYHVTYALKEIIKHHFKTKDERIANMQIWIGIIGVIVAIGVALFSRFLCVI